ncbi:hypothetical protein ACQCZM_22860, partial [Escherichia coli]|uniref:hypothetical protein n=1 Tax=Escherichia coli TaxID=562 RepID=UPI003CE8AD11
MSHNLQDILAAASGYQSVTSEPALNLKRPKTLDDYPVIPPASKKVSVISSGFAPIFPDTCYHLTHYWPAAVDIPVASDNPVHYADA